MIKIADILEKPRKTLPIPLVKVNTAEIRSRSDRENFAILQRLSDKNNRGEALTRDEKKQYRRAVKVLRERSLLQIVTKEGDENR